MLFRSSTHAPETCASTNSATWAYTTERYRWSEKRDSNPRPQPWQGCALPTELFSPFKISIYSSGTLSKSRAKNGTRTRDPNLGKVVLYQLSYFRNCECKDKMLFCFCKITARKSNGKFYLRLSRPMEGNFKSCFCCIS